MSVEPSAVNKSKNVAELTGLSTRLAIVFIAGMTNY